MWGNGNQMMDPRMMGGQGMSGGEPPLDLSGLPPEILYALIEMLSGGGVEADQVPPGTQFQSQPGNPGEIEALLRFLQQQGPQGRMQMDPAMFPDMASRVRPPWDTVEPGR